MPSEAEYLERIELKTASLYAACCQGAALLTEADPDHVAALGAFGTNLGLAFQMTDDILDLVGDEAEFGKAVGRDLEEGMATLPMIYAAAESGGEQGELARRIVVPGKTRAEVIELLRIIRASGGPERARARALAFHDDALGALDRLPVRGEREALRAVSASPGLAELRDRLLAEVDRVLRAADGLDASQLSWIPSAKGANSLIVLAAHVVGAAERHVVRTVGAGAVSGTRDEEFAARGDLAPIRARWETVRGEIVEILDTLSPDRLDEELPQPSRVRTIHGALIHAIAHAAEHAGQAELTRDLARG
jgi:hypothetical protein